MRIRLFLASTCLVVLGLTGCSAAAESDSDTTGNAPSSSSDAEDAAGSSDGETADAPEEESAGTTANLAAPSINIGPLISGNVDGSGQFVSSLDDFRLVEEATAYEYGLDCDRFRWHYWSEDQKTHEVAYANQAALDSLRQAADEASYKMDCSPTTVEMAPAGETVKFQLSVDANARQKLGEMLSGAADEEAIAANMACRSTNGVEDNPLEISLDYCATTREDGVLIVAYHRPSGADLAWLAAMVNAYADNDSQVQEFIDEVKLTLQP
ncbi:hypothetical protein BJQ94_02855 [Cryobacterium sp. SO2]|uniref:hypothetical protein n=1 Tax=Cryobacterium sp. SO2 TaxID=1897060 RepID=UPI00223CCD73|nr:hypothetical protein [Cryobacterium sp. SO2]WEO77997.1 hypothetical protein BJQ94_02855 [Cryobacterium sp. SO2]